MPRRWTALLRSGLAAVLMLGSACSQRSEEGLSRPDFLLISVDTLRPDHLGLYGYPRPTSPNIDRWFGDGIVFQRAYTTESNTSPSVASLLTGRLPQNHRVRFFYQLMPSGVRTLADYLGAAGYQTAAVVSNIVLTDEAMGLGGRFSYYDDYVDEKESSRRIWERSARRTTDAALQWLRLRREPEKPMLLWVHYIDPHGPYEPPGDRPTDFTHEGTEPFETNRMPPYQVAPGVTDGLEYVDRYDEEIGYCDREIGRLLDGVARMASDREPVIIFTADHGETMREHARWFTHGYHVYESLASIPLALRIPGRAPARVDAPVSLVDVAPTILELAGVEVPDDLDGRSLLDVDPAREILVEARGREGGVQRRALVSGRQKWVVEVSDEAGKVVRRYVFDLEEDPGEEHPLPWSPEDEQRAASLLEAIARDPDPGGVPKQYVRGLRLDAPKVRPDLKEEELEKLRALGYVE